MMMGIEPVSNFPSRFHPPGIAKVRGGSKLFISRGPAIIMKSRLPGFGAVLKLCHPLPLSRLPCTVLSVPSCHTFSVLLHLPLAIITLLCRHLLGCTLGLGATSS